VSARQVVLLCSLAALWGASYLLIKYALEDLEPAVVVFARAALAALFLLALIGLRRGPARAGLRAALGRPFLSLGLGLVAIAAPFTLITVGELWVPSGLTAVLIAPTSLFVALMAPFVDPSESIERRQGAGLVLGLVGVALLVGVETVDSPAQVLGALAILGAAACYAASSFVVKGAYAGVPAIATSCVSVSAASILMLPAALASAPAELPGLRAALAVLVLGLGGTAIAFVIFYRLIAEIGAGRASLVAYLAPALALVYGASLLDERITPVTVAGLVLILAGVALASRRRRPAPDPVEGIAPDDPAWAHVPGRGR
jgi:drug/metabolite transporter (DMT)-like permease